MSPTVRFSNLNEDNLSTHFQNGQRSTSGLGSGGGEGGGGGTAVILEEDEGLELGRLNPVSSATESAAATGIGRGDGSDVDLASEDDHLLTGGKTTSRYKNYTSAANASGSTFGFGRDRRGRNPRRRLCATNKCFNRASQGCCNMFRCFCCKKKEYSSRTVWIGRESAQKFPPNKIRNQKYNIFTFFPVVLFNQFKFFLNLFFLLMAVSQLVPVLKVGLLYTYWAPLGFVLSITMVRELIDDIRRYRRDKEVNSKLYTVITPAGRRMVPSADLKVGDVVSIGKGCRVPADMVILKTSEHTGSCFIRTDQLDGETDWKLRLAIPVTQKFDNEDEIISLEASIYAEKPQKDIHSFIGKFKNRGLALEEESLSIENTLWANTVVASGTALGIVVYSGPECRAAMNNSAPRSKVGLLDLELNNLTKVLFLATLVLSFVLVCLKGFKGQWYFDLFRFVLLFSYLIPISLRVNLDLGKMFFSWSMHRDKEIPGTVARSTTIPEELGRIMYLLSDKTGTLTQNQMIFKKLHLGTAAYSSDTFDEIQMNLSSYYSNLQMERGASGKRVRKNAVTRIAEAVKALALCHNVTPVYDDEKNAGCSDEEATEADQAMTGVVTYQASSPDEVALVEWSEQMGLTLIERTLTSLKLRTPLGDTVGYSVLQMFPFTSESKRMGIILKEEKTGEITFYMKGADVVMCSIVQYNDWLEEEVDNMAREGLRTLVVAKKALTPDQYVDFEQRYTAAKLSIVNRSAQVAAVLESLERDMELLCVTGVEDKLQDKVRTTLEQLRNAGVKVWMLTGDKLETATCIAKSSRLVSKNQSIHVFKHVTNRAEAHQELNAFRRKQDTALVIQGSSLEICLEYYEHEMMELATACPAVVCCRCSPEQKADVVRLIHLHTNKRTAAIGDGGNDVSMIQAANVGVGIVGKEGKQASLAADFSITQFSHFAKLMLVHGRNSYKRSASLSQFIIHRGLIITTMQAIFSACFYFSSVPLYEGVLMVGYATIFTMFPVFSLVLDEDVSVQIALTFPELYKDLTKGRSLSYKTFFIWTLVSIYQGGIIMYGSYLLFEGEFVNIVTISFTALILTELIMVGLTIRTWHWLMIVAEISSIAIYSLSVLILREYFDTNFMQKTAYFWKVAVITLVSCLPLYILKLIRKKVSPPSYQKLS